jgi:vacuolar-type H+-ATPase subunit H
MHEMTEQLQTVIDAAERAADAIRHDAEDQARQHLVEAQRKADQLTAERVSLISDLTDDLIRHAETVKQHSEQMVRALEDAISSVTTKLDQPGFRDPIAAPSAGADDWTGYGAPSAPAPPAEPAYEPPPPPPPAPPASEQPYQPPAYEPPAYEPPPYQAAPPPAQAPQSPQAPPPAPTGQPAPMAPPPPPSEEPEDQGGSGNVFRPESY